MGFSSASQAQEHRAEADGGAVHEHELAGHRYPALSAQRLMHLENLAAAVGAGLDAVGDGAHAVVEQRPVDEARPDVQGGDRLRASASRKPPGLVGAGDACVVARLSP